MVKKNHLENPAIGTEFDAVRQTLSGAELSWLDAMRGDAMAKFTATGIPGPRVEEWKYTNLTFLANEDFTLAKAGDSERESEALFAAAHIAEIDGPVVVFVDGYISAALSSCDNENIHIFSQQPETFRESLPVSDGPFNNLNRALMTDGYMLEITDQLSQPLQIIYLATSGTDMKALRTRCQIKLHAGAQAQVIETYLGAENTRYWSHAVSDITVESGAELAIYQFQLQGRQAIHMTELHSDVAENASFSHVSLQLGAEISRNELINSFSGERGLISLRGAYLGQSHMPKVKQSHDIFTRINHDHPHCESHQLYRGVLDAGGKGAFQGKVVVAQDAQKTNANQSNKNLLLSRKAEANAKPELLIYADDVKCSHGATVGEIDPDQFFYLRARGMDEQTAKGLLVQAFVAEVFDGVACEILQQKFREKAADWLSGEGLS